MKNRILRVFALMLVCCTLLTQVAFGLEDWQSWLSENGETGRNIYNGGTDLSKLHVRVNGREVRFTDAHPYIDENNRTMIPLRAAVEALGADVTWNQATRTASISKNGITVDVTIGSETLTVNNNGVLSYVTMDTMAVLNPEEGRTYVPIRYVAESLGAFVDYSDAFKTVGIYQDQLTPDEISYLQSFDWDLACSLYDTWEEVRARYDSQEDFEYWWPYYDVTPKSFANARECLYDNEIHYFYQDTEQNWRNIREGEDEVLSALELALSELNYQSELYNVSFRADSSCILTGDDGSGIRILVRGYFSNSGWLWSKDETYDEAMRKEADDKMDSVQHDFGNAVGAMQNFAYKPKPVWGYTESDMESIISHCAFYELPVQVYYSTFTESGNPIIAGIIPLVDPSDYLEAPESGHYRDTWEKSWIYERLNNRG